VESTLVAPGWKEQQFPPEKRQPARQTYLTARGFVSSLLSLFHCGTRKPLPTHIHALREQTGSCNKGITQSQL